MKPQMIKISATKTTNKQLKLTDNCPYQILRDYAAMWGSFRHDSDPFFILSDKTPVTHYQINNSLKTLLSETGFDSSLYSSHSLQIRRTSDLAKLGLSVVTIKKIGRWRSNAVYRYLHD